MRIFKLIGLSIVILFLVITVISLFIPSHIRISKALNVTPDRFTVLPNIYHLSGWQSWNEALMDVSVFEIYFLKEDAIRVRDNTIYITEKTDSSVIVSWQKDGQRPVINGINLIQQNPEDSITLQYYMDFHLHWYPWEKFRSLFFESIYGPQLEKGLENLRKITSDRL